MEVADYLRLGLVTSEHVEIALVHGGLIAGALLLYLGRLGVGNGVGLDGSGGSGGGRHVSWKN